MKIALQQLPNLLAAIPMTLALTALSFTIGVIGGLPLMLLRRSRFVIVRSPVVAVIDLIRGVPVIAWLFLIFFGIASGAVKLSPFVSSIAALGLVMSAVMAEIYRAGVMAVDRGQWEAGRALGLREARLFTEIVWPQAVRVAIPPSASALLGLLKDTAVASTVGVSEITYRATLDTQTTYKGLSIFIAAALIYIALSLPMAVVSRRLDRRLRRGLVLA
jgi:polar amino acid transport system permease protein